ncbi:MAG: phosphonate metabolism protein/1,5-bisphosphokinase (PRPP-forming) PhnN [Sulfitobacter sp.]
MTGRLIAVVGPSGVGKDTVMGALAARHPQYVLARRVITRPADAGGEAFESASLDAFTARAQAGEFALHWQAHGLHYAIPAKVSQTLNAGQDVLANLSRSVLEQASEIWPTLHILHLTAAPETLAARLANRGRETAQDIAARLRRADRDIPTHLNVTTLHNDGPLDETVAAVHRALAAEPK